MNVLCTVYMCVHGLGPGSSWSVAILASRFTCIRSDSSVAMLTPPLTDLDHAPPSRSNGFVLRVFPGQTVSQLLQSLGVRHLKDVRLYSFQSGFWFLCNRTWSSSRFRCRCRRGLHIWPLRWKPNSFVSMYLLQIVHLTVITAV